MINESTISELVSRSGLSGYTGNYHELGGGELNDTFLLEFEDRKLVLRIAKFADNNYLEREAEALQKLSHPNVPGLVHIGQEKFEGRNWVIETHIPGSTVSQLTNKQLASLGELFAHVHSLKSGKVGVDAWASLLEVCADFGDQSYLLNHPDDAMRAVTRNFKNLAANIQPVLDRVEQALVHGDATVSNILVTGDKVSLIDWELSTYRDPLSDFSTFYYDDTEYNQGKWRIMLTQEQQIALFDGYRSARGEVDYERLKFWMYFDKVGAAQYLYWRLNMSDRPMGDEQKGQYELDLKNLVHSLRAAQF